MALISLRHFQARVLGRGQRRKSARATLDTIFGSGGECSQIMHVLHRESASCGPLTFSLTTYTSIPITCDLPPHDTTPSQQSWTQQASTTSPRSAEASRHSHRRVEISDLEPFYESLTSYAICSRTLTSRTMMLRGTLHMISARCLQGDRPFQAPPKVPPLRSSIPTNSPR